MKKKIFFTVLLVALFIVLIPQDAHAIPMGDYVYNINPDGTTCTIIQYTGGGGDITIPNQLDGFDVTAIQGGAFYLKGITSVSLPNKLDKIYDYAFAENTITSLTIPDSVTEITSYAFDQNNISTLTLGNSLVLIGNNAFSQNSLSSVTLPDSLRFVYENAFANNPVGSIALPAPPDGYIREWNVMSGGGPATEITDHSDEYVRDFAATPIVYTITYNLDSGTNHASNPTTYTVESAEFTLQAPTRDGHNFTGWTPSDITIEAGSTGDMEFTASWEIVKHNVTPTTNTGGTASPSTVQQVSHGGNITFTLTPDEGYWLSSVDIISGHCTTLDRSTPTISRFEFENITSDTEISFYFEKKQYTVNVASTSGGGATPATATIVHGNDLVITSTPDSGYHTASVTTDKGNVVVDNNNGTYTIKNITDATTVNVAFELKTYNITIKPDIHATTTPSGSVQATHGEDLAITVTPKEGYVFDDVDVTGDHRCYISFLSDGSIIMTLTNIRDDNEVTFDFSVRQYTVNIISGVGGCTTPAIAIMEHGDDLVITPTPDSGYHTASVTTNKDNEVVNNSDGTYTIKNITAHTTANISFVPIPVGSITLTDDALTMNVGVTSALNTTFPYTILPADAANKAARYSSTNPEVAEVNNSTGMIITKKQGITQIYAISEQNSTIYDALTLTVKDPAPAPIPPQTHSANIKGRLVDSMGQPLAGYPVTLCSDPITTITDANGYFRFTSVPFTNHTLIINRPDITEAGRFSLNLLQGTTTSSSVTGDTIDITFTGDTENIDITLQQNMSPTGFDAGVTFAQKAKPVYDPTVKVENPATGYYE